MTAYTYWYLEKNGGLSKCEITDISKSSREIKIHGKDPRVLTVHPEGVIWGKLFPRIFKVEGTDRPEVFVTNNRVMVVKTATSENIKAIPKGQADYRFQPFIADVIDSVYQRQNVILTGGTGVGKTTHITQLANRINQPLLRINFNGETRMSDLIGKVHVLKGETHWFDGVLPMAMRNGWWLLLDELDFAEPAVLSLLHPVLEEESLLVLKENSGEIVRPHPEFRIFATANSIGAMSEHASSYSGTNEMNEAFLDRWQIIMVDNLTIDEEMKVIKKTAPSLKNKWVRGIAEFAFKARNKDIEYPGNNFSTRKSIAWARKTELHRDPIVGARLAWLDKMPKSEQEPMLKALEVTFGNRKRSAIKRTSIKGILGGSLSKPVEAGGLKRGRGRPRKNSI